MICSMLGYDVSFAFIHAVKLAQQGSVLERRVGMIGLSLSLKFVITCSFVIHNVPVEVTPKFKSILIRHN